MNERINHPEHYSGNGIECIDAMLAAYGTEAVIDFCRINAFKYLWRAQKKNGIEDLRKAEWYVKKLIELEEEANG